MADENKVIEFQSVEDVPVGTTIDTADGNTANTGNVAGITSPSINATSSVFNIPPSGGADFSGWSTDVVWSATDYNTVAWTGGDIKLANGDSYTIDAGNTGNITAVTYIYADVGTPSTTLLQTTVPATAVGAGKLMVCVASPSIDATTLAKFQAFGTVGTGVFITADNIAANTITTNELAANAIDGMTITGATIRTEASPNQRVELSTSHLTFYDEDNVYTGAILGEKLGVSHTLSIGGIYTLALVGFERVLLGTDVGGHITVYTDYVDMTSTKLRLPVGVNLY